MTVRIGIPRALLYYNYYPLWRTFFEELGAEIIVSSPSTKGVLKQGLEYAVDDVCLPIKIAYGHVLDLRDKADFIFLPRMVSISSREYVCPKFLGLPDMIKRIRNIPPLIDLNVNFYKNKNNVFHTAVEAGKILTGNLLKIWAAYRKSLQLNKKYIRLIQLGLLPEEAFAVLEDRVKNKPLLGKEDKTVALIGHPYLIYDSYINMNIITRLKSMGAAVATAERISGATVKKYASELPKKMFWTMGRRLIGSSFYYMDSPNISGMIHVAAFGCGLDSITGELIERKARAKGVPFLNLTLDEHTGEAGVITRLEAFLDMVSWKEAGNMASGCAI